MKAKPPLPSVFIGSVRERESQTLKVLAKGFEAVDDKGQVGEVLLHFHSAAVGEATQLDEFVVSGALRNTNWDPLGD